MPVLTFDQKRLSLTRRTGIFVCLAAAVALISNYSPVAVSKHLSRVQEPQDPEPAEEDDIAELGALATISVALSDDLDTYIKDRAAVIALGRSLFWDTQTGSDGDQACASRHWHAGVDARIPNTLSPRGHSNAFGPQRDGQKLLRELAIARFRGANADIKAEVFRYCTGLPTSHWNRTPCSAGTEGGALICLADLSAHIFPWRVLGRRVDELTLTLKPTYDL